MGSAGQFNAKARQLSKTRERIDALLVKSLESGPSTPMKAKDWRDIRDAGRRIFLERLKK